jgi:hypothetical protein
LVWHVKSALFWHLASPIEQGDEHLGKHWAMPLTIAQTEPSQVCLLSAQHEVPATRPQVWSSAPLRQVGGELARQELAHSPGRTFPQPA